MYVLCVQPCIARYPHNTVFAGCKTLNYVVHVLAVGIVLHLAAFVMGERFLLLVINAPPIAKVAYPQAVGTVYVQLIYFVAVKAAAK